MPKAEGEGRKDPDVQDEMLPILKPFEVAEAGMSSNTSTMYVCSVFHHYIINSVGITLLSL